MTKHTSLSKLIMSSFFVVICSLSFGSQLFAQQASALSTTAIVNDKPLGNPKAGDLLFQQLASSQSEALIEATGSPFTHCGLVIEIDGAFYVQEALRSMTTTPYESFIDRHTGRFVLMRLKQSNDVLTPQVLRKMQAVFESFSDRQYDLWFKWSDDHIYCSELIYKIYERGAGLILNDLKPVSQYDLSSEHVKGIIKQRFGDSLNTQELVISPKDLMSSPHLETVFER